MRCGGVRGSDVALYPGRKKKDLDMKLDGKRDRDKRRREKGVCIRSVVLQVSVHVLQDGSSGDCEYLPVQ